MNPKLKFWLAYAGASVLLVGGVALTVLAFWTDLSPDERLVWIPLAMPRVGLFIVLLVLGLALIGFILQGLFKAYVTAPHKLAEEANVILAANPEARLTPQGAPDLHPLIEVVNQLAESRQVLQRDVEQKIRQAKTSLEEEKNRLAALMSELTQSVVVCNLDGRILLYNNRARLQFKALSDAPAAAGGGELIGLGRSIYTLFERSMITHALESIRNRLCREGVQPVANFLTATRAGQLLRVQMAPVLGVAQDGIASAVRPVTGYVLMLDNITRDFEQETRRDHLLQTLTEGSRASLANVRAAVETLAAYPDMELESRDNFVRVIADEVRVMSRRLDETVSEFADALKARWPLEEMLAEDLVQAAQRRIENRLGLLTKVEEVDQGLWIKVDSFSLLQGLTYLAYRLKSELSAREVRFRVQSAGRLAHLDLMWTGTVVNSETLMNWELEPMNFGGESSPLTLRDVVERHGGEIWAQREKTAQRYYFRLLVPTAVPQESLEPAAFLRADSRPEYYDFDLFKWSETSHELDDRLLTELTFTVFDTETTGLEPGNGDEIIQIGATRIVNNKLLKNEAFEQLIDPCRSLNPASSAIHGITEDMLRGCPTIDKVLPSFHAFCEDTVLVAHNAAFDMRFLQLKEEATGIRFQQPVIDTLLLSAVIHPQQESHRLEAIAERFGVTIIGRHTAIGDAIVTGEVFLKMLPLLAEKGVRTLRQAREASEKTYYARLKY